MKREGGAVSALFIYSGLFTKESTFEFFIWWYTWFQNILFFTKSGAVLWNITGLPSLPGVRLNGEGNNAAGNIFLILLSLFILLFLYTVLLFLFVSLFNIYFSLVVLSLLTPGSSAEQRENNAADISAVLFDFTFTFYFTYC